MDSIKKARESLSMPLVIRAIACNMSQLGFIDARHDTYTDGDFSCFGAHSDLLHQLTTGHEFLKAIGFSTVDSTPDGLRTLCAAKTTHAYNSIAVSTNASNIEAWRESLTLLVPIFFSSGSKRSATCHGKSFCSKIDLSKPRKCIFDSDVLLV